MIVPYNWKPEESEAESVENIKPESGPESGPEKTKDRILQLIKNNPHITSREMAKELGMARSGISKYLRNMQENAIITHIGPNKGGHWEVIENN